MKTIALITLLSLTSLAKGNNDSMAGVHVRKAITYKVVSLTAAVCTGALYSIKDDNVKSLAILSGVGAVMSNIAMWCELWLAAKELEHGK